MRILKIILRTALLGLLLNTLLTPAALFGLAAMGVPAALQMIGVFFAMAAAFIFAAWSSVRAYPRTAAQPENEAGASRRSGLAPLGFGLAVLALVVGAIQYLEFSAESSAKAFCAPSLVGTPLADVARAAQQEGSGPLRHILADSVTVGYTGLPPFSRHLCTVTGKGGTVVDVRYSYLD